MVRDISVFQIPACRFPTQGNYSCFVASFSGDTNVVDCTGVYVYFIA